MVLFTAILFAYAVVAILEPFPAPPFPDWMSQSWAPSSIKILPSHGAKLDSNPPNFWWNGIETVPKTTYKLEVWSATQSWTFKDLRRNYLTLPFEVPTNTTYAWRVTRFKWDGTVSVSLNRTFQMLVGAESIGFLPPDFISRIAASPRPRLIQNGNAKAQYLASPLGIGFSSRLKSVDWYFALRLNAPLPPDSNLTAASFPAGSPEWAAFLSKVAGDVSLLTSAIYTFSWSLWLNPSNSIHLTELRRRILHLCTYNVTGTTSAASQDQANRDIMMSLAMAYDVIKPNLTDSDRTTVLGVIRARAIQVYRNGDEIGSLLKFPHDSHGANTLGYLACTAIITIGEIPEAVTWLNETLPMYIA
ncbi:hypothetical protein HDU99_005235, partial [Rhizoclosmatium hyalinum]